MTDINTGIVKEIIKNHIRNRVLKNPSRRVKPKRRARVPRFPGNIERQYYRQARKWITPLTSQAPKLTAQELRTDDLQDDLFAIFDTIFEGENREEILATLAVIGASIAAFSMGEWIAQLRWVTGDKDIPKDILLQEEWVDKAVKKWAATNYRLIKNASADYIKKVNDIVAKGIKDGISTKDIIKNVTKAGRTLSNARIKLIVRDQVGKLNSALAQGRQQAAGLDWYEWLTSQDERVVGTPGGLYPRGTALHRNHFKMNGNLCDWNDDSIYSTDQGKTWQDRESFLPQLHVGRELQCRCVPLAFFGNMFEDLEEEVREENGL